MDYEELAKVKSIINVLQLIYDAKKYQLDGMHAVSRTLYNHAKIESQNLSKHKGALEDLIDQIKKDK